MDAHAFKALSEALQVSETDIVTRMRADYEHRGMAAEDCRASQQRSMYKCWNDFVGSESRKDDEALG
jgi:hypothetical protein